jgi:endoglucanase
MKSRAPWIFTASVILVAISGFNLVHAGAEVPFRHGVGVHRPLNWASVKPADPTQYDWPPFASAGHHISDAIIGNVRGAGLDFVRLTVDPGPFLQMTGQHRQDLDQLLLTQIHRFRSRGIGVVVNFHSNSHVAQFRPETILASADSSLFKAYTVEMSRVAGVLDRLNDPGIAFEPVNEPPAGYDAASAARWQTMMEVLYRAVRNTAPNLLIVVTGAQGGSFRGLKLLDPSPFLDGNVMYSFHYYEPHLFTHQGVVSSDRRAAFWRDMRDLPYPPRRDMREITVREAQERIDADASHSAVEKVILDGVARSAIETYFDEGWNANTIDAVFDQVTAWASRFKIDPHRILLGEFGATRADSPSLAGDTARATWLRDVRCAAERRGFAWSIWELNGEGGMAIVTNMDSDDLDPVTLKALGLATDDKKSGCDL